MKILQVNTFDDYGGAAKAAYRIHRALVEEGVESCMRVLEKTKQDNTVFSDSSSIINSKIARKIYYRLNSFNPHLWRWHTDNNSLHTFGNISSGLTDEFNICNADVLNLHWISNMLSVKDIGMLRKPLIWTFHDMWPFCGGEHYSSDLPSARFRQGYRSDNRPSLERGPDLNRKTWNLKKTWWRNQHFDIVCPSRWLAQCARESVLFSDANIHIIPYAIETDKVWKPISREIARMKLGITSKKKIILFGALGGTKNQIKGADLLKAAIEEVIGQQDNSIELAIFGQDGRSSENTWPCPVYWLGEVKDEHALAIAYSAADVMVVPSRQDNLPNTAIEAQACGIPVVAFKIGGLPDIITHSQTGWLAQPFDASEMAFGIQWVLEDENRWNSLSELSRKNVLTKFSPQIIAQQYSKLYEMVIQNHASSK